MLKDHVDVFVRESGHGISWKHDLVGGIDRIECEILDRDVDGNADANDGSYAQVAKDRVQLGSLKRRQAVEARQDEVTVRSVSYTHLTLPTTPYV